MTDRVVIAQLARELGVPSLDVTIGLSQLRTVQLSNARVYEREKALLAMEAYYRRVMKENRQLYAERRGKSYRKRAEMYANRLDIVMAAIHEWRVACGN